MSKIRTYESNSQHVWWCDEANQCCSWCQRYELMRAIHNCLFLLTPPRRLFLMSKIRTYESNSQPHQCIPESHLVVPDVKDTNLWEQFTTHSPRLLKISLLFLMSKIRTYESNSQLLRQLRCYLLVVPDVKDTNLWEQFTTVWGYRHLAIMLFLMSKIRTYESNSQLVVLPVCFWVRCSWCQRYELMRAIHN